MSAAHTQRNCSINAYFRKNKTETETGVVSTVYDAIYFRGRPSVS